MSEENKIGSQLRIRLPNEYLKLNIIESHEALTLQDITKRFAQNDDYKKLANDLFKTDLLFYGYKPLTHWQKWKLKFTNYWSQYRYIWTIVRGGDIHENCGDW